ncbi:hypothetical protein D3C81_1636570 [compost metagenome]
MYSFGIWSLPILDSVTSCPPGLDFNIEIIRSTSGCICSPIQSSSRASIFSIFCVSAVLISFAVSTILSFPFFRESSTVGAKANMWSCLISGIKCRISTGLITLFFAALPCTSRKACINVVHRSAWTEMLWSLQPWVMVAVVSASSFQCIA